MFTLIDLEAFARVVRERSFAKAGKSLAMTPSAISKAVARLELQLGVSLLVRTTRSIRLTEPGASFHVRCLRIMRELAEAKSELSSLDRAPHGRLGVALPWTLATRYAMPLLTTFAQQQPHIELDLHLSDRFVDLVTDDMDVALRIGSLADSSLVVRKLATTRLVLVASPAYLEKHGVPQAPSELSRHACLLFRSSNTGATLAWQLRQGTRSLVTRPVAALTSNSAEALARGAESGLGITQLLSITAAEPVARGALVPVLESFSADGPSLSLLTTKEQSTTPKVRALSDFLASELRGVPPWERELRRAERERARGGA
ncbi:MAG: yhjC5 [Myxococcaceae bacterium]|nr:yhjC5 [Myxococcaceae bacterium]